MLKRSVYGFELPRRTPRNYKDFGVYTCVTLSRREWRSFVYWLKVAQSKGFMKYHTLRKHGMYDKIVTGEIPKEKDRMLKYSDCYLIDAIVDYFVDCVSKCNSGPHMARRLKLFSNIQGVLCSFQQ